MVAESLTQDQVQARAMGAGASLDTALVEVGESQAQVSITRNPGRLNLRQCAKT